MQFENLYIQINIELRSSHLYRITFTFIACRYLLYATPTVTCPICRKKTDLPPGGVRRLPDNFVVPRLVDIVCGPSKPHPVAHGTTDGPSRVITAEFRFRNDDIMTATTLMLLLLMIIIITAFAIRTFNIIGVCISNQLT